MTLPINMTLDDERIAVLTRERVARMAELERLIELTHLVRGIDTLPNGLLRVQTEFQYPDGSSIDVFVPPPSVGEVVLSDMGQTISTLLDMQVKPWQSKKRSILQDAIEQFGVTQEGAEFRISVRGVDAIPVGIVRLGQACLRASDLMFTRRASLQTAFVEDVEEVLSDAAQRGEALKRRARK